MSAYFLKSLPKKRRDRSLKRWIGPPVVQSGMPLEEREREQIKEGLDKWMPGAADIQFRVEPGLGMGIQVVTGDRKVGWNLSNYLQDMEKRSWGIFFCRPSGEAMREESKREVKGALIGVLKEVELAFDQGVEGFVPALTTEEVGRVKSVGQGIVWAEGLGKVKSEEMVTVGRDISGMVLDILPDRVGIILFGPKRVGGSRRRGSTKWSCPGYACGKSDDRPGY